MVVYQLDLTFIPFASPYPISSQNDAKVLCEEWTNMIRLSDPSASVIRMEPNQMVVAGDGTLLSEFVARSHSIEVQGRTVHTDAYKNLLPERGFEAAMYLVSKVDRVPKSSVVTTGSDQDKNDHKNLNIDSQNRSTKWTLPPEIGSNIFTGTDHILPIVCKKSSSHVPYPIVITMKPVADTYASLPITTRKSSADLLAVFTRNSIEDIQQLMVKVRCEHPGDYTLYAHNRELIKFTAQVAPKIDATVISRSPTFAVATDHIRGLQYRAAGNRIMVIHSSILPLQINECADLS
jgi:hypothetical protein